MKNTMAVAAAAALSTLGSLVIYRAIGCPGYKYQGPSLLSIQKKRSLYSITSLRPMLQVRGMTLRATRAVGMAESLYSITVLFNLSADQLRRRD